MSVLLCISKTTLFRCPLFRGQAIAFEDFKVFIATGATDAEVEAWILEKDAERPQIEIIKWNNQLRYTTINQLPDGLQEYMETYIPQFIRKNRPVYVLFDVYDIEEQRI